MIVVNALLQCSEETIEALTPAIARMEQASRAEEGCVEYAFSVEVNRPGSIRVTERWETVDALKRHFQQPHMAEFQQALAQHPLKSPTVYFYDAREIDIER